jgi:hypothetical protein
MRAERASLPLPSEAKRERLEMRVLERRQENVAALVELERVLSDDPSAVSTQKLENIFSRLPQEVRQTAKKAVAEYRQKLATAVEEERALRSQTPEQSPEALGQLVFVGRTGKRLEGAVSLRRDGAYFIFTCQNPKDYRLMYDPTLSERFPFIELFDPREARYDSEIERHGGTFHDYLSVPYHTLPQGENDIASSLLLLKGTPGEEPPYLVAHERQHFINHKLLDVFEKTERRKPPDALEKAARSIKDEVIAYIRDGSSGSGLLHALSGPLYEHLFAELAPEDAEKLRSAVKHTARALDEGKDVFGYKESRRAAAILLYDVPLIQIPKWLPVMAEFYRRRLVPLRQLEAPGPPEGVRFPSGFKNEADKLSRLQDSFSTARKDYLEAVFETTDEQHMKTALATLQGTEQKMAEAATMDSLKRDGALVPYGSIRSLPDSRPETVREAEAMLDKMLDALARLSRVDTNSFVLFAPQSASERREANVEFWEFGHPVTETITAIAMRQFRMAEVKIDLSAWDEKKAWVTIRIEAKPVSGGKAIVAEITVHRRLAPRAPQP